MNRDLIKRGGDEVSAGRNACMRVINGEVGEEILHFKLIGGQGGVIWKKQRRSFFGRRFFLE